MKIVIIIKRFKNSVDGKMLLRRRHSNEKIIFISFEPENKMFSVQS